MSLDTLLIGLPMAYVAFIGVMPERAESGAYRFTALDALSLVGVIWSCGVGFGLAVGAAR